MSIYKGGYITIDIGGANILADTSPKIPGIYLKLTESRAKPVIFTNFVANSVTYDNAIMNAEYVDEGIITFYAFIGTGIIIQVASDDSVTVTVIE